MLEVVRTVVLLFVHREVGNPCEAELVFVDEGIFGRGARGELFQEPCSMSFRSPAPKKIMSPDFGVSLRFESGELVSGKELENRRARSFVFVNDVRETLGTFRLSYHS